MILMVALLINFSLLGSYLKFKDIRLYYLVTISVIACSLIPTLYFERQTSTIEMISTCAVMAIWFLTNVTNIIYHSSFREKIYWALWGIILTIPAITGVTQGLFWTIFLSSLLYILFQSKFDELKVRSWMLFLLVFDLGYIFLSPTLLQKSNELLAPPLYINRLEVFLMALVPMSLCLKIFGHGLSYIRGKRNRRLCLSELLILSLLFFYKFTPDLYIDKYIWHFVSVTLVTIACLIFIKAIVNKKISFETVSVLLLLQILTFISYMSIYELNLYLIILPVLLIFLQSYLLKSTRYYSLPIVVNILLIPVLTTLAASLPLGIVHVPLLLFGVAHTAWLYLESPQRIQEDYAS